MYGFKKIRNVNNQNQFSHHYFLKGREDLLYKIIRKNGVMQRCHYLKLQNKAKKEVTQLYSNYSELKTDIEQIQKELIYFYQQFDQFQGTLSTLIDSSRQQIRELSIIKNQNSICNDLLFQVLANVSKSQPEQKYHFQYPFTNSTQQTQTTKSNGSDKDELNNDNENNNNSSKEGKIYIIVIFLRYQSKFSEQFFQGTLTISKIRLNGNLQLYIYIHMKLNFLFNNYSQSLFSVIVIQQTIYELDHKLQNKIQTIQILHIYNIIEIFYDKQTIILIKMIIQFLEIFCIENKANLIQTKQQMKKSSINFSILSIKYEKKDQKFQSKMSGETLEYSPKTFFADDNNGFGLAGSILYGVFLKKVFLQSKFILQLLIMQNTLYDFKQDEQNIKKIIDKEINGKTQLVYDIDKYNSQFQILAQDCIQQCERTTHLKGAKEMVEFKAQVISHEKVIEAIRQANFVEIQNVHQRFKRLFKEILDQISNQLGNAYKQEFLKLWLDCKNSKTILQDRELKIKSSETTIQIQEQELIKLRTQQSSQTTFLQLNKQLEETIINLEKDNNNLRESLQNQTKNYNDLKSNFEELNKKHSKLQQQFEEIQSIFEKEINQLKLQEQNIIKANKDLIELTNQLSSQVDKYKDLYEIQNQKNLDLNDQVKYWKSTHFQRLVDLQQSEQRIGSQKGYLFKYRREVQDLKRFKLQSEEAKKELSNARQTVHILNQQTEQLRMNYENVKTQNLNIQLEKTDNLNQILIKNASSTKKTNNDSNSFHDSPKKGKFDFGYMKKSVQQQTPKEELTQLIINNFKIPIQLKQKNRSASAKKNLQLDTDSSKNNIALTEFDQMTPFLDNNLQQFTFSQAQRFPSSMKKRIKRINTEG
ncbi:unnamed protein product [Paramecium sonneborni]|uniref:Uncharacterized protein n=1 Tax=Paramecium sonneborni TaxID=65129 RepID=A0A8S1PIS6_9CILI|nr:unnamed protein product [Paramecium sonneborni]